MTVYFALGMASMRIKIGYSFYAPNRVYALGRAEREPFKLLASCPGERAVERQWQQRHADLQIVPGDPEWREGAGTTEFFRVGQARVNDIVPLADPAAMHIVLALRCGWRGSAYRAHDVRSLHRLAP